MHTLRSDINYTVTGRILYTLLRYGVFVLESLVYRAWVWMTVSNSIARSHRLAELETAALQSGVSSIAAVLLGVVFLHFYFRKTISPAILRQKKQSMLPKSFLLLTCIFMGAQLIYSLFGNLLEFSLRALGYTAMEQLTVASAQSTTVSMFLYTAIFAPLGEELIYRGFILPVSEIRQRVCHFLFRAAVRRDAWQSFSDSLCVSHRTGTGIYCSGILPGLVYFAAHHQQLPLWRSAGMADAVFSHNSTGLSPPGHQHFLFCLFSILAPAASGAAEGIFRKKWMFQKNLRFCADCHCHAGVFDR